MRNKKWSKTFIILLTTFFACSILTAPGANAAYTVLPKVGQCFQYTDAQVSASYAPKNPISCSLTHNMETFAVKQTLITGLGTHRAGQLGPKVSAGCVAMQ